MEGRFEVQGRALRIEKAKYCPREGTSKLGCPIAKYVIRRKSFEEKFLVVVKNRKGHKCECQWIVMAIIKWDGIKAELADSIYEKMKDNLGPHGIALPRKCVANSEKTCACQGLNEEYKGASFTFGCSWGAAPGNGCKFGKPKFKIGKPGFGTGKPGFETGKLGFQMSTKINKFKLAKGVNKNGKKTISRKKEENVVEEAVHSLADEVSPMFKKFAPESYKNMTTFDHLAGDCRVGHSKHGMFI